MHPAAANRTRLTKLGVIQPNGDNSAPSRNVPANCEDASTISAVARSERVISINTANDRLPPSAMKAGQLIVWVDGRSAISTPQKPIRTAVQRRQKKGRDFEGRERRPKQLQPRPFEQHKLRAMPPDRRRQHDQRRAAAQQK